MIGGGTPSTSNNEFWDGDINWFSPVEIGNEIYVNESQKKITPLGMKKSSARLLPKGSILFTSRAGIGNMAILSVPSCTNQGFQSIVPNHKVLNTYFIFSLKERLKNYGEKNGAGSTFIEVSGKVMRKMKLNLPSIEEQNLIGLYFENLDKTITLLQRKIDSLNEVKKGLLQKLFPSDQSMIPKIRFRDFDKDWEQRELKELIKFINGKAFKQNELLEDGKYRVLRVGNFNTNNQWYYSNLELNHDKYIDKGDLVYLWATTFGPEIWQEEKVIYHYHIWKVDIFSSEIDKNYLYSWMKYDKNKILNNTNGSTMIHITKENMDSRIIKYPEKKEQIEIGELLNEIDNTITLLQKELELNKEIKKGFLQKLFPNEL
ncbi:restriction endonuclease subunit S [Macrococcus sp. EM39E]|uniref:restriction endonuclease subunit S n=1 Tax=Macrococcus animalis TaxID=3395467 RepID=UPI0039BEC9ED